MALIEFRGLAWDDPDGIFLEISRGYRVPYAMRGVDYVVAALAGRSPGDRIADVLAIMAEGYVAGDTAEDWGANRAALMDVLDENQWPSAGLLVVRAPLYGLVEGESASIHARVTSIAEGPIGSYQQQTLSIALEAVDEAGWVLDSGS